MLEILSTGQKIKRSRIYKGITLKELCKDKISISKMSCIENGKVKADNETIKYIADIIEIDYDYLIQDIYEQILANLNTIKNGQVNEKELENNVNINLSYAIEYEYYDLALELVHILFNYYLYNKEDNKCEQLISKYYSIYDKSKCNKATVTYYLDIASYLSQKEEYYEAIVYYSRLRELKIIDPIAERHLLYDVILLESSCYIKLKQYDKSYELIKTIINDKVDNEYNYSEVYNYYVLSCIALEYKDADEYINKYFDYEKEDKVKIALAKLGFGEAYFYVNKVNKALLEIEGAIKIFPTDDLEKKVGFINNSVEILFNNNQYDRAYELIEENLNLAISVDNIKLIEKAYYLKAMILNKQGKIAEAEMYLNLSLDSLYKFGTKKDRCSRYIDMAYLYYKLESYKDAVKYFNFAVEIEKTM